MAWTDRSPLVGIQWATNAVNAADWVWYTFSSLSDIRAVPKKPSPSDSPLIDGQPGWIAALNIQGVTLTGDHIGFNMDGEGRLVVGVWNDDPVDWPPFAGSGFGWLYTFDSIAPDPSRPVSSDFAAEYPAEVGQIGGQWFLLNTRQTVIRYADLAALNSAIALDPVEYNWVNWWINDPNLQPWSSWPRFNKNNIVHGVWLDPPDWLALEQARTVHVWEEWR